MAGLIRILSDLHLGHPGCRIPSAASLRPLFEGVETAVFNGDTVEQRHPALAAAGARHLAELGGLLADTGTRALFIRGNHDPGISDRDHLDLADGRLFLTHGDALFRHLSPWSPQVWRAAPRMEAVRAEYGEARLAADLAAHLECTHRCRELAEGTELEFRKGRLGSLRGAARHLWPPGRPARILTTWLTMPGRAHELLGRHRPGARAILFGHSHFSGVWRRGDRAAVNTGGFVSMLPARIADLEAGGCLVVRRVDESGGRFAPGGELARIALEA